MGSQISRLGQTDETATVDYRCLLVIQRRHRKPEMMDLIMEAAAERKDDVGDTWVRPETDLHL